MDKELKYKVYWSRFGDIYVSTYRYNIELMDEFDNFMEVDTLRGVFDLIEEIDAARGHGIGKFRRFIRFIKEYRKRILIILGIIVLFTILLTSYLFLVLYN